MDMYRIETMAKTAFLFSEMPSASRAGWFTAAEMKYWSGVTISSVYRYLKIMETLGFIKSEKYECRKIICKRFHITNEGLRFVADRRGE